MSEFAPMLANLMDQAKGDELTTLRAVTGLDTPATIERFEKACPPRGILGNLRTIRDIGPRNAVALPRPAKISRAPPVLAHHCSRRQRRQTKTHRTNRRDRGVRSHRL